MALVLGGGGARGAAHVGVLRALEHLGYRPSAIVGVSMGAIVGATYALNPDWYRQLVDLDRERVPMVLGTRRVRALAWLRSALESGRALRELLLRWGALAAEESAIRELLSDLTLGKDLEEGRVKIAAVATDLSSGARVIIERGNAAQAVYASSALAGLLPPDRQGRVLLADGAYADIAPVDVARETGAEVVIAVDASQPGAAEPPANAFQAFVRAMEIGMAQHAQARFGEADLVIRPHFPLPVQTLDFGHHRLCVAAGLRAVLRERHQLAELLRISRARRQGLFAWRTWALGPPAADGSKRQ